MKKKLLIFLTLIFFVPFVVNAEELKLDWQKEIIIENNPDDALELLKTKTDGFIFVFESSATNIEGLINNGERDIIIRFYDKNGNMLWQKCWGGNGEERISYVFQTENDEIVIIGYSDSTNIEGLPNKGEYDVIIVKYDKDGNLMWQKRWGSNKNIYLNDVLQTKDDEIILLSYFDETDIIEGLTNKGDLDAAIVKYDKDGNMLWQKSWGGNDDDVFTGIFQTEDGEFIAYGSTESKNLDGITQKGSNIAIVKYGKDGNVIWQKAYGGNGYEYLNESIQGKNGLIIQIQSTSTEIEGLPNIGDGSGIIVMFDKEGNISWQKSLEITDYQTSYDFFESTEDGFFLLITSYREGNYVNAYILQKYDKNGNQLWQKEFSGDAYEEFYKIFPTNDGGLFIEYTTSLEAPEDIASKIMLEKYDKNGNTQWRKVWNDNRNIMFEGVQELVQVDEEIILSGIIITEDKSGIYGKIIKYDKDGNILWQQTDQQILGRFFQINKNEFTAFAGSIVDPTSARLNKYSIAYNLENIITKNGGFSTEQQGNYGIVTPVPDKGYEVDKVIIKDKDGNVLDLVVTKLQDGTYSFELSDDVTVEVLFKETIENPKTGILDVMTILIIGFLMSITGFFIVKNYSERLEI